MALSMYQASVPVFIKTLGNLSAILDKAAAFAAAKKVDPSVLINYRLAPDMLNFARQVQIATDHARGAPARLAGVEVPAIAMTEASLDDLKGRIDKTVAFLQTLKPEQVDGSEDREVSFKAGPSMVSFKGQPYLVHYALPNFFFHVTTAYAILRHCGIDIGKKDYIGQV